MAGLLKPTDRLKLRPSTRTQAQRFRAFRTWLKMRQCPESAVVTGLEGEPKGPNVQLHLVVLLRRPKEVIRNDRTRDRTQSISRSTIP